MCVVSLDQVNVMAPRLTSAEELAPRQTCVPTVHVAKGLKHINVGSGYLACRKPCRDIQDRLGRKPGDSRTPNVLEPEFL